MHKGNFNKPPSGMSDLMFISCQNELVGDKEIKRIEKKRDKQAKAIDIAKKELYSYSNERLGLKYTVPKMASNVTKLSSKLYKKEDGRNMQIKRQSTLTGNFLPP